VLEVRTVQSVWIEEDRHRFVERHPVLVRIGCRLARIPLEHLFSIYIILQIRVVFNWFEELKAKVPAGR
jgi:hypothetical protein